MKRKYILIFTLLCILFAPQAHAQFGIGKAIKNKVEKNKEPEKKEPTPAPAEVKKEPTAEEIEAELKKVKFPEIAMKDAELEKKMIENMTLKPTFFEMDDMSQLKVLHITSYDWNVAKDKYGNIEAQYVSVCIGFQKDGKCYKKDFFFRKDYLGGGQYQKSFYGYAPNAANYKKQISCETLDAVVAKDKPTTAAKPTGTTTAAATTKPTSTATTAKTTTTTSTSKPATTTSSASTTKPSVLSTMPTQVVSLSAIGINTIMTVPKGTTVRKEGEFRIIEKDDIQIQAEVTTLTLAEMKADVKTNDMYNGTGKIVSSNSNGFIFTCIEDEEEGKWAHLEFFKTIAGKKYRFIDNRLTEKPYTAEELQPFLEALNTLP